MLISNAWAQAAPAADPTGGLMSFLPIILMFAVLYFLMIRPQAKRQKEQKAMLESIKSGDEVVTIGGILGRVTKVNDAYLTVEISDTKDGAVAVQVQKGAVQTILPKGTLKSVA